MKKKFDSFKYIKKIKRKKNNLINRDLFLRLDKNEMTSSLSNFFLNKIRKKINTHTLTTYPEINKIYKLIAKKNKINEKSIIITAGSDIAIKNCFELFVKKGSNIITTQPTYGMVDVYSKLFQARQIKISFDKNLELKTNHLISKINRKISLIIIANPNSPTGKVIKKNEIIKILNIAKKNNVYVLIDECYFDYSGETCLKLINKYNNLIISRSFSKSGLAGCRIGYLVSSPKVSALLYKFRPLYEISNFSVKVLELFLKYKIGEKYFKELKRGKSLLIKFFEKKEINFFQSSTNFLLIKLESRKNIKIISKYLKKSNILFTVEKNIPHHKFVIRFTLGPIKEMKFLINRLSYIYEKKNEL
jgi:histidinol-phosphate aminotransferase